MGDRKHTRKSGVQLHTSIAYRVRPGAENQVLHRDHGSCNIQRTGPTQQTNMISTFVAGTKVTIQNGYAGMFVPL